MGFYAPPTPNHGFLETGCSVLGGIQVNHSIKDLGPACSSKDYYIPQYNLAYYWHRPYMVPHSLSFPQLLTRTLRWNSDCMKFRNTGHWPYDTHRRRLRNRNLLAVSGDDPSIPVRLWSVNELSTRKRLMEFRLSLKKHGKFEEWVVAEGNDELGTRDPEISTSRVATQGVMDLHTNEEADVSALENLDDPSDFGCRILDLKTPLLELHPWRPSGERCRILARGEKELCLCDTERGVALTLFGRPVHSLSTIPYMNDEIVFLDDGGNIWFGEVGENFARVKSGYDIESVAGSDHPRLIYAAGKENVWLIDLRDGTANGELLYTVPDFDDTSRNSYHFQYEGAFQRPTIHQLCTLNDAPQMLLISTSRKYVIVDERMRGLAYLEMAHTVYHGGNHIVSAPPILDSCRNGTVHPFYVVQQTVNPGVQSFALYRHLGASQWSSLATIRQIKEPHDAAAFYREQPKYNVRISRETERRLFGRGPTRAVCCLDASVVSSKFKSFLFRMMDDGSLWYEPVSIEDDSELEEEMIWREAGKTRLMVENYDSSEDWEMHDDLFLENSRQKVKICDVQIDASFLEKQISGDGLEALQPLDTEPQYGYPEPAVVKNVDSEQLLSKVVLHCWEKYAY